MSLAASGMLLLAFSVGSGFQPLSDPLRDRLEPIVDQQLQRAERAVFHRQPGESPTPEAVASLAMHYHAYEFLDAATTAYQRAIQLQPDEPKWCYLLGHVLMSRGEFEAAGRALDCACSLAPEASWVWSQRGRVFLLLEQPALALAAAQRALDADEENPAALLLVAESSALLGDHAQAAGVYERLLELQPGALRLAVPLGLSYRALGETDKARSAFARRGDGDLLVEDPWISGLDALKTGSGIQIQRALKAFEARRFADAVELFESALTYDPSSEVALENLAVSKQYLGDHEGALAVYRRFVELSPEAASAHFGVGVTSAAIGDESAAREAYRKALALEPTFASARFNLANSLRRSGRCSEALHHFDQLVGGGPQGMKARVAQVLCLTVLGREAEAFEAAREGLAADATDRRIAHLGARLLVASKDAAVRKPERGLAIAKQLAATERSAEHLETLAMAFAATGQFEAAVKIQSDLLEASEDRAAQEGLIRLRSNLARYKRGEATTDHGLD